MTLGIETVRSSDVSKRFGFYHDEAMTRPIAVARSGAVRVVMLPASEYERLPRLDHVALAPEELGDDARRAIHATQPGEASRENDKYLD